MEDLYHYVLIREDIPIGDMVAQTIHAAGESNPGGLSCYAVALAVPKEKLLDIEKQLINNELLHVSIRETDPPYDGELMAIGIYPTFRSKNKALRRIVSCLPLIK